MHALGLCAKPHRRNDPAFGTIFEMKDESIVLRQAHVLNANELVVCFSDETTAVFLVADLLVLAEKRLPSHEECESGASVV